MVRGTGFEPVTAWMSTKNSTPELTSHLCNESHMLEIFLQNVIKLSITIQ